MGLPLLLKKASPALTSLSGGQGLHHPLVQTHKGKMAASPLRTFCGKGMLAMGGEEDELKSVTDIVSYITQE
ncbi:hypothetical protein MRX96_019394 [Rhipicephalus microplus]